MKFTVSALAVPAPVREMVKAPVSGPVSDAFGSEAVTVTVGKSLSAMVTVADDGEPTV